MKHINLSLATVVCLFSSISFAEDLKKIEIDKSPTAFDETNIYSYHMIEKEKTGDRSADRILKKYHSSFLKNVKSVNKQIDKNEKEINKDIDSNIKDGLKSKSRTQSIFDKNCQNPKKEEEHKQCQELKESVFNAEQKMLEIEVERTNIINQLENNRTNKLKGYHNQYKNLVGKLKSQVESNK